MFRVEADKRRTGAIKAGMMSRGFPKREAIREAYADRWRGAMPGAACAASDESHQIYFAASTMMTAATMTNIAIWTAMLFIKLRPFLSICAIM